MKSLRQSLIDYDMAHLKAVADRQGIALTTPSQTEAARFVAETIASPAAVAITLADLSEEEQAALQVLLENGGQLERPRFTRQFGPIRPMGPARLAREKPWQNPVNPAEGLWYRGLIFKGFQVTQQGGVELFYIPMDLLPLLETAIEEQRLAAHQDQEAEAGEPQPTLSVAQAPEPAITISGAGRLRENMFRLLVYLQTTPVRVQKEDRLAARDKEALIDRLLPPLLPAFTRQAELEFLLHLAQRAGLLVVKHGRLRPDPDPTRSWLQAAPPEQERQLQKSWRADPTWNDLWHVPGLIPQPTGWENSPLLARSKILNYLSQVEESPPAWLLLDDFVAAIKARDPDFQRPHADYESWYIRDAHGRSLMGFENWDQVEGALLRYLLTHLLLLFAVTEVGLPTESGDPTSFRITDSGAAFLASRPVTPEPQKLQFLRVDANFQVYVPAGASLYDRFQLARFAELDHRPDEDRVIYRITQASIGRALRNGVSPDQIVTFLARATNNRTPLKVLETLRTWGTRRGTVQIERATLLHLERESLVTEVTQHPQLGPLLGDVLGPKVVLIPPENVKKVRQLLIELGFLDS